MTRTPPCVLTINSGSSSIRFAVFEARDPRRRLLGGKVDRIGVDGTTFVVDSPDRTLADSHTINATNHHAATGVLLDWLEAQPAFASVQAVGHRVVHGLTHSEPALITPDLVDELRRMAPYDPEHLPAEIELVEAMVARHPAWPQIACFDTAFHRTMPRVATLLPIPRRYEAQGVRRYGFHGLSYAYLLEELVRLNDPTATKGRVILAHLGNGASLAAVRDGKSIDTSMGFTPTSGLVMGTRSGDLDPGLVSYLARTEQLDASGFQDMVNRESGLLGVSETSSDMHDLLTREATDVRAAEAVDLFCYQTRKWIGPRTMVHELLLELRAGGAGADALTGRESQVLGMLRRGQSTAAIAERLQIRPVTVRVIRTDEEIMIARSVAHVLGLDTEPRT